MKKITYGILSIITIIFVIVIILTLYGRNVRQIETDVSLSQAIDASLEKVMDENEYTINTKEKFVADFMQMLLTQFSSTSNVKVSVLNADMSSGVLSIEITQDFAHPNGNTGTVTETRTVILEQKEEITPAVPEETVKYTVSFCTENDVEFAKYKAEKNSECIIIAAPVVEDGKTFKEWKVVSGPSSGSVLSEGTMVKDGVTYNIFKIDGSPYIITADTKIAAIAE